MNNDSFLVRWSRFFITRYRISILIIVAILIAGVWGVTNNQRQDFPTIPVNIVGVSAVYPGASPVDVERDVLIPIERIAASIDGTDTVRSSAQKNFGSVQITINDFDRIDGVAATLSDEVQKLALPEDVETSVQTFDASGPSIALGLVGTNEDTTADLIGYADVIKAELENASPDIKSVDILPKNEFTVTITVDAATLAKNQLTYADVKSAVQAYTTSLPGGQVQTDSGHIEPITIRAAAQSLDDIRGIPLGRVTLEEVATIERAPTKTEDVHYVGYIDNDRPQAREAVYFLINKKETGDVVTISEAITATIADINDGTLLPDDYQLVVGYDVAPYVNDQLQSLLSNGYLGLILILVVLLFFINFRASIVVALAIPTVFLIALFILQALGFTLNILTLFALILTLGILVDNGIVIAEGMVHEIEKGSDKKRAALIAIQKLGGPVLAATLTTIVVFIPFASIGGIMGEFLKYIPYTIIIVVAASFFTAVSIVPLIGRWIMKRETYAERRQSLMKPWERALVIPAIIHYGQNGVDWLARRYADMMTAIYQRAWRKLLVIGGITVLLGVSFGYFAPQLKFEQFPSKDGSTIQVDMTFPAGTPFADRKDVFLMVQDEIVKLPYFERFYTFGNTVYATFTDPKYRTDDTTIYTIADLYNDALAEHVTPRISDEIDVLAQATAYGPPRAAYDIIIEFLGNDREALTAAVDDVVTLVATEPAVSKVFNGARETLVNSITVDLDTEQLIDQGVVPINAAATINAYFSPQQVGVIIIDPEAGTDDIILSFSEDSTNSVDDLKKLSIPSLTRGVVPLESVATIREVREPESINRLDGRRTAQVAISVDDNGDVTALNKKITDYLTEEKLLSYGLPSDGVSYGGEFSEFESDYSNLQIVFVLAMLAVYLILVYQFYSYLQPALILFAVPLALIGVFPGLLLVGSSLNMISGLGVIALVGIVVNDAIVLISTFNRYKEEYPDDSFNQRLVRAGRTRFKPIFSTSITTIGGILPLTILDPFWTGLGTSIISGLVFSTIGTLIAIPVLYSVGNAMLNRIRRKRSNHEKSRGKLS